MFNENHKKTSNALTVVNISQYLGGDVERRELDLTTAEDAILAAADGGIPFGPLFGPPSCTMRP